MANIPLQSITFPGLSDKYTTPTVDATLTQTGAAADAKKTGDEITGLKNELNQKADKTEALSAYIVETETGSIASFTDGADGVPVKDLSVAIEPVQDLHGQSAPYPVGGGKNKANIYGFSAQSIQTTGSERYLTNNYGTTISTTDFVEGIELTVTQTQSEATPITSYNNGYLCIGIEGLTVGQSYYFSAKINVTSNPKNVDSTALLWTGLNAVNYDISTGRTTATFECVENQGRKYIEFRCSGMSFKLSEIMVVENVADTSSYAPYENICPISGWTGANVTDCGVNVWDEQWENGYYNLLTGVKETASDRIRNKNKIPVVPNASFCFIKPQNKAISRIIYYDANGTFLRSDDIIITGNDYTIITIPSDVYFICFNVGSNYGTTYNHDISINYPATDTDYHAYNGSSVSADWTSSAGAVYGGTLDVTTGVLTVDRAIVDLRTLTWGKSSTSAGATYPYRWFSNVVSNMRGSTTTANGLCNKYATVPYSGGSADPNALLNGMRDCICSSEARGYINVVDSAKDSLTPTEFKNAMDGTQFVYELATPQTYQLTPQEVSTILGQNNIFADCGNVTVQYRADTKLYIDKVVNS